ncbi:MAG: energy transducer TonB [Gammaproteobacteria bacterium]|nr:energy transducer TonB [Gammaproteobacteria bacterium]MBU1833977.1 energy transducer TonB [Gammaproteobacteria bacterium]
MDKWTKGEQVNSSEPIPARKLLNLYAAFIAYTAYLKIDAIIASGEAGTTDLNSLLYALTLIITATGIFLFGNSLTIVVRLFWKLFSLWFAIAGAYWLFDNYVDCQCALESVFTLSINIFVGYLGVLCVLYFYIKSEDIWRKDSNIVKPVLIDAKFIAITLCCIGLLALLRAVDNSGLFIRDQIMSVKASWMQEPITIHYPGSARQKKIEGSSIFDLQFDNSGQLTSWKIIQSATEVLDNAALDGLKKTTLLEGKESNQKIKITFKLE